MQVHLWKGPFPNFGDQLNEWFWDRFLPGYRDVQENVLLVGIGTVLTQKLPREPKKLVIGSGVGYGRLVEIDDPKKWDFRAVRGPLSARALSLPEDRVITDPAILVGDLPDYATPTNDIDVAFVPHWESAAYGRWREACDRAEIHYIDPCRDADLVIREIRSCRHVLAESLHGAVVADAFGKTWVPIVTSSRVLTLKWVDWCASMELEYRPLTVPMTTLAERLFKSEPVVGPGNPALSPAEVFQQWQGLQPEVASRSQRTLARSVRRKTADRLRRGWFASVTHRWQERWIERAAAALAEAKVDPGVCSRPEVREARKKLFYETLAQVRADYLFDVAPGDRDMRKSG